MSLPLPSSPPTNPTNPTTTTTTTTTTSPPTSSITATPPTHRTLALPLPLTPHTTLHISLTSSPHHIQIFLTTVTPTSSSPSALGSFVYALPNRFEPAQPLCTALYSVSGSVEFATRVAKIVCKRVGKRDGEGGEGRQQRGVYVGCSVELGGVGGRMEEEAEGLRVAVEGTMGVLGREMGGGDGEGKEGD